MPIIPKGLSDEKAVRMLATLREGQTLRKFGVKRNCPRFAAYCQAHPEYAREALLRPPQATSARTSRFPTWGAGAPPALRTGTEFRGGGGPIAHQAARPGGRSLREARPEMLDWLRVDADVFSIMVVKP
jgi:hypothetical protein